MNGEANSKCTTPGLSAWQLHAHFLTDFDRMIPEDDSIAEMYICPRCYCLSFWESDCWPVNIVKFHHVSRLSLLLFGCITKTMFSFRYKCQPQVLVYIRYFFLLILAVFLSAHWFSILCSRKLKKCKHFILLTGNKPKICIFLYIDAPQNVW